MSDAEAMDWRIASSSQAAVEVAGPHREDRPRPIRAVPLEGRPGRMAKTQAAAAGPEARLLPAVPRVPDHPCIQLRVHWEPEGMAAAAAGVAVEVITAAAAATVQMTVTSTARAAEVDHSLIPGGGTTTAGYNALNAPGYIIIRSVDDPAHTSAVLDMLSAPTAWGSLDRTDATNGGSIAYATAASTDGIAFDAFVAISAGGIIQSALKRYLKVRSTLTLASGTYVSPVVSKLIVNFTTSTIYVSLANHRGQTCMSQMERYVKLADYELRFRGDGSMVIGPKTAGSYVVHLTQENGIIDVSDLDYGIPDRVIRAARVRYQGFVSVYGDVEAAISRNNSRRRRARESRLG